MEQRESNIELEAIDEALLADYEGVILPDIYELLEETAQEEALTEHYLCIGAKEGSVAVAALILELEEETGDLVILSLFVAQEYRRQYIATDLIHSALQIAAESFIFWEEEEEDLVQMKMSSLLPEDIHEVWHAFLESVGFTDFIENPQCFALDEQDLQRTKLFAPAFRDDFIPDERYVQVSELKEEEQQELFEVVLEAYTPYYSIVSGSADARETVIVVDQVDMDTYRLLLAHRSPATSERELADALNAVLWRICQDTDRFTLIVRADVGDAVPLLQRALADDAQMLIDEQGWMDVVFQA